VSMRGCAVGNYRPAVGGRGRVVDSSGTDGGMCGTKIALRPSRILQATQEHSPPNE
jgi:hypothetical protein